MWHSLIIAVLCYVGLVTVSFSQERDFGLGAILGEPTGISAKRWVSQREAIDAGVAWSLRHEGYLHVHADYLWHFGNLLRTRQEVLPYVGAGGIILGRKHSTGAGIRLAGGITWQPVDTRIDVFMEVAPVFYLLPATEWGVSGGIGSRFYF